jgi:hypothetical protein
VIDKPLLHLRRYEIITIGDVRALSSSKSKIDNLHPRKVTVGTAMLKAGIAIAALLGLASSAVAQEQTVWKFDNLSNIGGMKPKVEGTATLVDSPLGKAVQFNGKDTALLFPSRPLVGAKTFTVEVILKPEGGEGSQRVLHITETDAKAQGATQPDPNNPSHDNDLTSRIMLEVHLTKDQWFLHGYVRSKAGFKGVNSTQLHPFGPWYALQQTYDGKTYRTYVDGVLEQQVDVPFSPHGPGNVMVGQRMAEAGFVQSGFLKGTVAEARFSTRALQPSEFLKAPK